MRFSATDLVVRYPGSRRPALDGVTMEVPDGSLYAVLGPNGSGKSTLMKAVLGLLHPEVGRALVLEALALDGHELRVPHALVIPEDVGHERVVAGGGDVRRHVHQRQLIALPHCNLHPGALRQIGE